MSETEDEMLQRWRRVAENDASTERRASYWLATILIDPSKDNLFALLNWIRESPDTALQFHNLLIAIQDLGLPFSLTLRNMHWLARFAAAAGADSHASVRD